MKITLEGLLKELSLRGIEYDANRVGRKPWSSAAESGPRGFGTLCEAIDFQLTVSSKAAEAPGGQAEEFVDSATVVFGEPTQSQADILALTSNSFMSPGDRRNTLCRILAAFTLAPAAPSERADEILKESPVKFQHNGFEHQVDRMAQYVIDTHPGTSLAAAYRAVCERLANRAQARAGLSSQEGK